MQGLVADNRIFKQRMVDVGIISKEDAIAWGFTGPCIRASGVAWDIRKSQPYDAYHLMDFDVPVSSDGDCYARFMVRMQEMRESLKIIKQCAKEMPAGSHITDNRKVAPPSRGEMKRSMEALIHHFKLYTEGLHVPAGDAYAATSAPPAWPTFRRWISCARATCWPTRRRCWAAWISCLERLTGDEAGNRRGHDRAL